MKEKIAMNGKSIRRHHLVIIREAFFITFLSSIIISACQAAPGDLAAPTGAAASSGIPSTPIHESTVQPTQTILKTPTDRPIPTISTSPTQSPQPGFDVRIDRDIPYMKGLDPDVEDETLDVYTPNEPGEWPIVIYAHGSEDNKDNEMSRAVGSRLAAQGFAVFVIDYEPQSPGIIWVKHGRRIRQLVETASCAIRFARAKAPDFNGSPDRVIWTGFSAGGYAGGFASFHVPDDLALWDEFGAKNDGPGQQVQCAVEGGSDQVDDLVMLSSSFYLPPEAKEKDPQLWDFLNQIYPPGIRTDLRVRMIHGTKDNIVPYVDAQSLYDTLKAGGYDVELEAVEGGGHGVYLDQMVETILKLTRDS